MDIQPKRSEFEAVKEASQHLRGSIADELANSTDHLSDPAKNLLKFHGSYQQEDRDARKRRSRDGVGKHHMFMVRCKIPGGKLSATQYLEVDSLASKFANGTVRATSRQGLQLHGVLKTDLKTTIRRINETLLTTLGACGDVNRNVMACPAPLADPVRAELQRWSDRLAEAFAPRTSAYHEIWLDHEAVSPTADAAEPIYGNSYLPRKFKIALSLPDDNCVDVFAQDLGFLASVTDGRIEGFEVLVGGGMGMTHGNAATFPQLAQAAIWIEPDQVLEAATAVITLFRDHGNRGDRKRARLKYVLHDWGMEKFREVLSKYLPFPLVKARGLKVSNADLHLGWHPQGNGKWFYGLSVQSGRIKDFESVRIRSAIREIASRLGPSIRLTAQQDVLFCDLPPESKDSLEAILDQFGVPRSEKTSGSRQLAMACPAIPTCGLAISESERVLPDLIDQLEAELRTLGLEREAIGVRVTGCPNGCARPYQSDIGIVGRSGSKYVIYLGGTERGDRLNFEFRDLVPLQEIIPSLRNILAQFAANRVADESFGDFCHRLGVTRLRELAGVSLHEPPGRN